MSMGYGRLVSHTPYLCLSVSAPLFVPEAINILEITQNLCTYFIFKIMETQYMFFKCIKC